MADTATAATGLSKTLGLNDLIAFGIASILGSGGFNLISKGVVAGGPEFPAALGTIGILFQGASKVYSEAYQAFRTNTSESDVIQAQFGTAAAGLGTLGILGFNIVSISTILVFAAKSIFPTIGWWGQISAAIAMLLAMCGFSLQGIDVNRTAILLFSAAIVGLMGLASAIGIEEGISGGGPGPMAYPHTLAKTPNFINSLLYFYFVLAGFDALMKFVEESKDPDTDIPRSFYLSNAISLLLTIGVAYAYMHVLTFKRDQHYHGENALGLIIESAFGTATGRSIYWVGMILTVVTAFISFLATTRYMYSYAAESPWAHFFRDLNEKKVPWKSVLATTAIAATAILVNHVDSLVKASDFFLSLVLMIVSAAVTAMRWKGGKIAAIEGMTTVGFAGLLVSTFLS